MMHSELNIKLYLMVIIVCVPTKLKLGRAQNIIYPETHRHNTGVLKNAVINKT